MIDIELPEPAFKLTWRADYASYHVSKPNIDDTDCYTADQLHAAILADREKRAQAAQGVERVKFERKVYRKRPEYREYLNARFGPEKDGLSFPWQGHRWAYQFTGFDDAGDFDSLYRFESTEASKPVQADDSTEAANETNAVLASRYFDLLKVVEAYEKHGVTCQTFRHFVDTPCAECNSVLAENANLRRFLDRAAAEGCKFDGIDAFDLYMELFPEGNGKPVRAEAPSDKQIAMAMLAVDDPLAWGKLGAEGGKAMIKQFVAALFATKQAEAPTASNAEPPSEWDSNPDGVKPGQDSPVRMDPNTGAFDAPEEYEGRDGSNPSNAGGMIAPAQTVHRAGAPHPTASNAGEREALRYAEMSMAAMREALMPSFEYVGVSLRISQEDHAAIRSALAGLSTSLHMVRAALAQVPEQVAQDSELLDWLTEQLVDTIYLDDGRIIDVGTGRIGQTNVRISPHDLRAAIRAARTSGEAAK